MDYREEIVKALSKVFYSDCGRYYTGVACGIEPISLSCNTDFVADVDAAVINGNYALESGQVRLDVSDEQLRRRRQRVENAAGDRRDSVSIGTLCPYL